MLASNYHLIQGHKWIFNKLAKTNETFFYRTEFSRNLVLQLLDQLNY